MEVETQIIRKTVAFSPAQDKMLKELSVLLEKEGTRLSVSDSEVVRRAVVEMYENRFPTRKHG